MKLSLLILFLCYTEIMYGQLLPVDCNKSPMFIFNNQNTVSRLYRLSINPLVGVAMLDGLPQPSGLEVNAIGYRLQDKMVYGVEGNSVIRIDGSGASTVLTNISETSFAGDVTPDGQYLVLCNEASTKLLMIDLQSGNYEVKEVNLVFDPINIGMFIIDIAFNPISGILYAFDGVTMKLATIDINTGRVNPSPFVTTDIFDGIPALFFDSFGNLWGHSLYQEKHYLLQLSIFTGKILAKIPLFIDSLSSSDGCSCPGAFIFQKTVYPDLVSHCGQVDFVFTISNQTRQPQLEVQLEDWMPAGVTIEKILKNPFGGAVLSGVGTDYLYLDNLTIPVGMDSIIVRVIWDELPSGTYKNQAILKNVTINSLQLENLLSDDPRTHIVMDSTAFRVDDLKNTMKATTHYICPDSVLLLDASLSGVTQYLWDTGEKTPTLEVSEGGDYLVEVQTACELATDTFYVIDAALDLDLGPDFTIQIGDTIPIVAQINTIIQYYSLNWMADQYTPPFCRTCLTQTVSPSQNTVYSLLVSNEYGCKDFDELKIDVKRNIYISNIFSPNGDGVNDVFFIASKNPLQLSYWQIYDRWGNLVFERKGTLTNTESQGWNPVFHNKNLADGVYTWIAEIIYPDGKNERLSGNVTVLR